MGFSRRIPLLASALLTLVFLCGCQVQLYGNLSESAANEIMTVLKEQGIKCGKAAGAENTFTVTVDEEDFERSMNLLRRLNLPRPDYESMGTVFAKSGIVSTPTEERARMVYALSQELSETYSNIDGVLDARVHIVMREVSDLGQELSPASVSVVLKVNEAADSPGTMVASRTNDIRNIAVNAVPDLRAERVQVVIFSSEAPIPRGDSNAQRQRKDQQFRTYMMIGGGIALLLVAAGAVFFLGSRKKGKKKKTPPPVAAGEPEEQARLESQARDAAEGGEEEEEG